MAYAVYLPDGDIKWVSNTKPIIEEDTEYLTLECADDLDPDAFWVNGLVIENRTAFPATGRAVRITPEGFDIILSGIPKNTTVTWPDRVDTIENDGRLVCSVNIKTSYVFELENAAHFLQEVIVYVE